MTLASELERLQQLHRDGTLTDAEFARAKAVALGIDPAPAIDAGPVRPETSAMQEHLQTVELQNEIEGLDREWMLERDTYMTQTRRGRRLPNRAASIVGLLVGGGFALFWTTMALAITSQAGFGIGGFFPLFGVIFLVLIVVGSLGEIKKAGQYEKAEARYKARKAELTARLMRHRREREQ